MPSHSAPTILDLKTWVGLSKGPKYGVQKIGCKNRAMISFFLLFRKRRGSVVSSLLLFEFVLEHCDNLRRPLLAVTALKTKVNLATVPSYFVVAVCMWSCYKKVDFFMFFWDWYFVTKIVLTYSEKKMFWRPQSFSAPGMMFPVRSNIKSDRKWKWQSYELDILGTFPVIFSPTTSIASMKLRIWHSFWCAQPIKIWIGSKSMT